MSEPLVTDGDPVFTQRSGPTWADPFTMYEQLRRVSPVHRVSRRGARDYWVLTRHRDVMAAARDHETFSSAQGLTITDGELDAIGMAENPPMVMQDPPTHTTFRKLVARDFTPRQVSTIEPRVHEFVSDRLDHLATSSPDAPWDVVGTLLKPLPSMVVAEYLGVREDDWPRFDEWTQAIVGATSSGGIGAATAAGPAGAATMEMLGYFTDLIAYRRDHPGDDTVSHLVAAGLADDDPAGLLSILAFTFTMVAGGNDTTTGMLGGSLELLAADDAARAQLASWAADDDRRAVDDAVDELLRMTSPVQGLARTTTRPVTYDIPAGTVTIPADVKVLLCYGSANRDPAMYGADAEQLDLTRRPRNILTFSHGVHHCLGASAARVQARVTLTELLRRHPDFTVDSTGIKWAEGHYVRRPTYVPFRPN